MSRASTDTSARMPEETRWRGLLCRRTGWRLTRRGWAALVLLGLGIATICFRAVYPFLAVNAPVEAEALVVEGWVADYALEAALRKFETGQCSIIYVTGGPMERGAPLAEYKTYAALGAAVLTSSGRTTNEIQTVPAPKVRKDRTYASALALREWLDARDQLPTALNVLTVGPHARRTRLLYEKAFGPASEIGVISIEDEDYEARRWWTYSQGVRTVMSETVAYIYVRFFFSFSRDKQANPRSGEGSESIQP